MFADEFFTNAPAEWRAVAVTADNKVLNGIMATQLSNMMVSPGLNLNDRPVNFDVKSDALAAVGLVHNEIVLINLDSYTVIDFIVLDFGITRLVLRKY
jgi:hypothetical protein